MTRSKKRIVKIAGICLPVFIGCCISYVFLSSAYEMRYPEQPGEMILLDRKGFRDQENWGFLNAHDPAVLSEAVDGWTYVYSTDLQHGMLARRGCQIRRSRDLVSWEFAGWALPDGPPPEVDARVQSVNLWAPDCVRVGDEYRLYYSASLFGKQQSAIALAVSTNPGGPFAPRGIVLATQGGDPVNAIDPCIVRDEETGTRWMAYGSFWNGIHLLALDEKTGMIAPGQERWGIRIASRSHEADGAVEGASIVYNAETGYYYLFVSYGSLFSDYNVRVARSRSVTGPYVDHRGLEMTDTTDPAGDTGLQITTGYRFPDGQGWFACGHNSVLQRGNRWFMLHHARPEHGRTWAYLHVRTMHWTHDGWPVVSPMLYAGETVQPVPKREISGQYDAVFLEHPAGGIISPSVPLKLGAWGRCVLGEKPNERTGRWSLTGDNRIRLEAGQWTLELVLVPSWDRDQDSPVLAGTGIDSTGTAVWARKKINPR